MRACSILAIFLFSSCNRYCVPIDTENHPACSAHQVVEIELSPILDIPEDLQ